MTKFSSSVHQIPYSQRAVYNSISDMQSLERIKDRVPEDKIKDFSFDHDSVGLNIQPVGELKIRICDREEPKCVKFETVQSPIPFYLWIQVLPVDDSTSKMKVTVDADIPFMLKPMVEGPLVEGLEKIADALSMIPYDTIDNSQLTINN